MKLNRGAPLDEGRAQGPRAWGSRWSAAERESGGNRVGVASGRGGVWWPIESSGGRVGAARVFLVLFLGWLRLVVAMLVRLGCVGRWVLRSAHHPKQVVPVHMPNTGRIGPVRQIGRLCINCCPC